MTEPTIQRINRAAFSLCLTSLVCGIAIGLLAVWGVTGRDYPLLWKALGSCCILFTGTICALLAIQSFRTNEET